jgi:putative transposase
VWTGDVTYIRTQAGFCYLAVVIDLFSRNIVGFAMSDSPDSKLNTQALNMAYTGVTPEFGENSTLRNLVEYF